MKKGLKVIAKIIKGLLITVASIAVIAAVADAAWIHIPEFKAPSKIEDVEKYAKAVADINVTPKARIIAVGEATHGNADFQEIKLEVLKQMVEKNHARSFALEVDFGDGIKANDYIHGGEGTAEDAMKCLSFTIYQTEEVKAMLQWMRDYNDSAAENEKLSFYGFDMQVPDNSFELIRNFCEANDIEVGEDVEADIEEIKSELLEKKEKLADAKNYELILRACDCVIMSKEYYAAQADDYISMNNMRDGYMAENVKWISEYEKSLGNDTIVIAGHNGHVQKKALFYEAMGKKLSEMYGDEYFVISTDYYHTVCNINAVGSSMERGEYHFCSADPLAKVAKNFNGSYFLNFDEVEEGSETYSYISNSMTMGSLGEGYSFMMKFLPTTNRVKSVPNELSDAMIFVYEARPFTMVE